MDPHTSRFALFTRLGALEKPLIFPTLAALADRIHRARDGAAVELQDTPLQIRDQVVDGVSIWTRLPDSDTRHAFLGYAYLAGQGREALQTALQAQQPVAVPDYAMDVEAA